MIRRSFLKQLAALPFLAAAAPAASASNTTKLKILMKSAWGSDDPTKAAFPFLHGDAPPLRPNLRSELACRATFGRAPARYCLRESVALQPGSCAVRRLLFLPPPARAT